MLINEKHIVRLYQLTLLTFVFLLPIYRKIIPYIIVLLIITWLLDGDLVTKARRLSRSAHRINTLLFSGIYLIYLIGLLYTGNFSNGLFDAEVKLSLLIFPVIFSSMNGNALPLAFVRKVLISFVFGVLASMLLCYSVAIVNYMKTGLLASFYYNNLAILIHPSYLAMYVSFAIFILLYFNVNGRIRKPIFRILSILLVILFELFIIMLSSKAGILSLVLTIALFVAYIIFVRKRILAGLSLGGIVAVSFMIMFLLFPVSAERFEQSRDALGEASVRSDVIANSTGERIMIWWYSFEITNENFISGVGTGDVKTHLLNKYEEKGMSHARQLELNAHNQYLQTMIAIGIIGLIILMLCLILPALYSLEHKHYLYLVFLILIAFNFLFESMLETQAGVVFYAFFNAFLFAIKKDPASSEAGPN